MRPVTDTHHVSRAKLAYIIDATAAPICMIAPISSWAAAVSGYVKGYNGLALFIRSIPFNFYSLMTIVMILVLTIGEFDYGPMRTHEYNAVHHNDLYTTADRPYKNADEQLSDDSNGRVADLIIPVIILIIACVMGMIYTGGFFDGASFVDAFANSSASLGLSMGSGAALVLIVIYFLIRRTMSFTELMNCVPEGFQAMVPPILILTFAWTLKSMTDSMDPVQDDRAHGRRRFRGRCHEVHSRRLPAVPAGDHLRRCLRTRIRNRNFLGNLRNPDPDRCCPVSVLRIQCSTAADAGHLHLRMLRRRRMRRPLLPDFGYDHHGVHRCAV